MGRNESITLLYLTAEGLKDWDGRGGRGGGGEQMGEVGLAKMKEMLCGENQVGEGGLSRMPEDPG